jgi:two-component system, NtrC family, response regulator GlrR
MIGCSASFQRIARLVEKVAANDAPVLIEGETGTGKEVVARAIHERSARGSGPFIAVNCGALPDSLLESQLFGHRRGAFTGAREDQSGLVALGHSGTLLLDEVDALTQKAQVSLLRFLQDKHYRPVGAQREENSDVRIIAASNRPLHELVLQQKFRMDLLYRLKLMHVQLPPLRDRKGDIPLLARHFVESGAKRFGCSVRPISSDTLAWFEVYQWPGNVRELEHLVYNALLLCDRLEITVPPPPLLSAEPAGERVIDSYSCAKKQAIAAFERSYLGELIEHARGNVSVAARLARTERRHLGRLLKKYRLGRADNLGFERGGVVEPTLC